MSAVDPRVGHMATKAKSRAEGIEKAANDGGPGDTKALFDEQGNGPKEGAVFLRYNDALLIARMLRTLEELLRERDERGESLP